LEIKTGTNNIYSIGVCLRRAPYGRFRGMPSASLAGKVLIGG